jgi:hypothetical protein
MLLEKLEEAGIPKAAYDEDVARVRRLIPGPVRRTVRRIPDGVRLVAEAIEQSGVPQMLRRWFDEARANGTRTVASHGSANGSRNGREASLMEGSIA